MYWLSITKMYFNRNKMGFELCARYIVGKPEKIERAAHCWFGLICVIC